MPKLGHWLWGIWLQEVFGGIDWAFVAKVLRFRGHTAQILHSFLQAKSINNL